MHSKTLTSTIAWIWKITKKSLSVLALVIAGLLSLPSQTQSFQLEGKFQGCKVGQYYPIADYDLLLRCDQALDYTANQPYLKVRNLNVSAVNNQKMKGSIVEGRILSTSFQGHFTGCTPNREYAFQNDLLLVCSSQQEADIQNPKVKIILPVLLPYQVLVHGILYPGTLYQISKGPSD